MHLMTLCTLKHPNTPPRQTFIAVNYIMRLEYWAGIIYDQKMNLFFFLIGFGGAFYTVIALFYYYIYVYYFELFAPLPFGGRIPGTLNALVFMISLLFFRYHLLIMSQCISFLS